jgi:hypothetical protein
MTHKSIQQNIWANGSLNPSQQAGHKSNTRGWGIGPSERHYWRHILVTDDDKFKVSSIGQWDHVFVWLTKHSLATRAGNLSLLQKSRKRYIHQRKGEQDVLMLTFTTLTRLNCTLWTGDSSNIGSGQGEWICECPSTFVSFLVMLCHNINAVTNRILCPTPLKGNYWMELQSSRGTCYQVNIGHAIMAFLLQDNAEGN